MRVIAGRLGGRPLKAPAGRTTRPTSDRVREALFSMLGTVDEMEALDLFAGTGALGIEALSRGARRVVFVERDPPALESLAANLESLGLGRAEVEVRRGDAFAALGAARANEETYDLVFIDPPYRQAHDWETVLSSALPSLLRPAGRVVVESDRRGPIELEFALELERERRYGNTSIKIHRLQ